MNARQYNLAHTVFLGACDIRGCDRDTYIEMECGGDPQVKAAVLRMLENDRTGLVDVDPLAGRARLIDLLAGDSLPSEDDAVPETVPSQIGEYRVIRKVGQGGMGAVFEAEQEQPRRRVAVKVLRQGPGSTTLLRRFRREIELLGRLQHPGIAQIYSAGSMETPSGVAPYFAMEFVDGLPLTRFADENRLSLTDRLLLLARACDVVHFAHQQGIVHRDLKPSNMLVMSPAAEDAAGEDCATEKFTLKILDFGIARALDDTGHGASIQTEAGQIIGTICYMSPEQLSGDPGVVDIRSDVYTLGVIMHEVLTGRLPHDLSDKSLPHAARIVAFDAPARLSSHRQELRGDLEAIVTKALEKDKAVRYPSASEMGADLRRYLRSEPVSARPLTVLYQFSRFARRNRAMVFSSGAAIAFLLLGIIGTSVGLYRAKQSEQRALASEAISRRDAYRLALAAADASWRSDPVQARAALESAPRELRGWEWKHFQSRMDAVVASYPSEQAPAVAGAGPTGPVAALVRAGTIEVVEMATGRVRATCRSDSPLRSPRLSRDGGRVLAFRDDDGNAVATAFDTVTGASLWAFKTAGELAAFSRDGLTVALMAPDQTIELRECDTGAPLAAVPRESTRTVAGLAFTPGGLLAVEYGDAASEQRAIRYFATTGEPVEPTSPVDRADPLFDVRGGVVVGHAPGSPRLDLRAVEVWPESDPGSLRTLKGHAARLLSAVISPDGTLIASSGTDSTLRLWDVNLGLCVKVIGTPSPVRDLQWSLGGDTIACGDGAGLAYLLGVNQSESWVLAGHRSFVFHAIFSPDGALIASGGWNREVRLWDARTGAPLSVVSAPDGSMTTPAVIGFSPDGSLLVADQVAWDVETLLRHPETPELALAPDRAAGYAGEGWRHLAGNARQVSHAGGQWSALSPDGSLIAKFDTSRFDGGDLRIASADGREVRSIQARPGPRRAVAISPDRRVVATAGSDKIIRIWNISTGEQIRTLAPQALHIYSLDFSPDGARLASAGDENTIVLWDTTFWEPLAVLRGHVQYVSSVSFSPDGSRLVSASGDGTVRVWDSEQRSFQRSRSPSGHPGNER